MTMITAEDLWQIQTLTSEYAHILDRREWGRLNSVFAADAVMEFAGLPPATGPEAIAEVCAQALTPLDGSQHLIGSPLVTTDAGAATISSYFHAQHIRVVNGTSALFTVAGGYYDRVELRSEGWRITHRRQTISWTSGDPRVLETLD